MKHDRFGQARVLSSLELGKLMECLPAGPHRVLATVMRYTACRVSEALQLRWGHVEGTAVLFPAPQTKCLKSREVPIVPVLAQVLSEWRQEWPVWAMKGAADVNGAAGLSDVLNGPKSGDLLFPSGRNPLEHMSRQCFDTALRRAAEAAGLAGVSTHSFRRSGLTSLSDAGIPLRVVQELSGHSSLTTLALYLQVTEKQKVAAAAAFA
jgi:integrase/recombinase XerD